RARCRSETSTAGRSSLVSAPTTATRPLAPSTRAPSSRAFLPTTRKLPSCGTSRRSATRNRAALRRRRQDQHHDALRRQRDLQCLPCDGTAGSAERLDVHLLGLGVVVVAVLRRAGDAGTS